LPDVASIRNQWSLFLGLLRPYLLATAAIITMNLAMGVLLTVRPLVIAPVLDGIAGANNTPAASIGLVTLNNLGATLVNLFGLDEMTVMNLGIMVACIYFAISAVIAGLTLSGHYLTVSVRTAVARDLTLRLHRHFLLLPVGFFNKHKAGDLVSRFTNDVNVTTTSLDAITRGIIKSVTQVVLTAFVLFKTDAMFATVTVGIGAIHVLITKSLGATVLRRSKTYVSQLGVLSAALLETINGVRVIKSFAGERYEAKRMNDVANTFRGYLRRYRIGTFYQVPARMLADALVATVVLVLVFYAVTEQRLTLAGAALFFFLSQQMSAPISELFSNILRIQELKGCAERIIETLNVESDIRDGDRVPEKFSRDISVRNVSFAYERHDNVLSNIDLTVKRGEFVAVVGPSGAGKSTLFDLILRFYDPKSGVIEIDGVDIKKFRQRIYRQQFGVVAQESLLFNDSVKANIIYSRPEDSSALDYALSVANASGFVDSLPHGVETVVGDRGIRLSGGQIQRIAMARAVYAKPAILVLDEATSSLDTESERAVQDALNKMAEEMTVLAIAHRLSTVIHADKIVVLSGGKIEAVGKHSELLNECPTYRRFYDQQLVSNFPNMPE